MTEASIDSTYFTKKIRLLREATGLTQNEMADRLGIKRATYAHWETGYNGIPMDKLARIAQMGNVKLSWFFDEDSPYSDGESELVQYYRAANPDLQDAARRMFKALLSQNS